VRRDILRNGSCGFNPAIQGASLGMYRVLLLALYFSQLIIIQTLRWMEKGERFVFPFYGHISQFGIRSFPVLDTFLQRKWNTLPKLNSRLSRGHPATEEGLPGIRKLLQVSFRSQETVCFAIGAAQAKTINGGWHYSLCTYGRMASKKRDKYGKASHVCCATGK